MEREITEITTALHLGEMAQKTEPCFVVLSGHNMGQKLEFTKSQVVVGRGVEADIVIKEENISRCHMKVSVTENMAVIEDCGSTNGTYVNSERVSDAVLKDGDLISIGKTILRFTLQSGFERAFHDEIYQSATHDELTTLFNRKYFQKHIESEFLRATRYGRALSLILIDIDDFKQVNDRYGHPAGDLVLWQVGKNIKNCVRKSVDIPARYGGEELAVLLPETNTSQARILAEKIRKNVEDQEIRYEGNILRITASIGIAGKSSEVRNHDELLRRCDQNLYKAKSAGKNCVVS